MTIPKQDSKASDKNLTYIIVVTVLTFILPAVCFTAEHLAHGTVLSVELFGKWFIFSAVGLRLFLAGIRQTTQPSFTAKEIFHIESPDVLPVVRELGFANLCFGLLGLVSLVRPDWRIASAFASGLYYGIAGLQHLIKRPAGTNEKFALWTDLLIFAVLVLYSIKVI
jgi:hypothetical protein